MLFELPLEGDFRAHAVFYRGGAVAQGKQNTSHCTIWQGYLTVYSSTSSCYMMLIGTTCPLARLLYFPIVLHALAFCVLCTFHISVIQCVSAGFCLIHPLGYFYVLHSESHTVFGFTWETSSCILLIMAIAHLFVARNGPKSFMRMQLNNFDSRYTCWWKQLCKRGSSWIFCIAAHTPYTTSSKVLEL